MQAPSCDQGAHREQQQAQGQVHARAHRLLRTDRIEVEHQHVQQADRDAHGDPAEQDTQEHRPRPPVLDQQQVDGQQLGVQRRGERQHEELGVHRWPPVIGRRPSAILERFQQPGADCFAEVPAILFFLAGPAAPDAALVNAGKGAIRGGRELSVIIWIGQGGLDVVPESGCHIGDRADDPAEPGRRSDGQ